MADIRIFTGRNCGWAVRNYAALIEKGIEFDTIPTFDQSGKKSPRFLAGTPYGMTPVLLHRDIAVFESTLINDYIDDSFPKPPLMPSDPRGRIEARKWIHFCEFTLFSTLKKVARTEKNEGQNGATASFRADLGWFCDNALKNNWQGPYFFGAQFSLLDIVFHTLFESARQIQKSYDERVAVSQNALQEWRSNINARPSIKKALKIQEQLPF